MTRASRVPADPSKPRLPSNRRTGAFERRVGRALLPFVEGGERIVVACSGGPDSVATLVAVARSAGAERVTVAHFDHRLRPAADVAEERGIVEDVAARLGVPVLAGRAARVPADRSEDAAREARYRWLAGACRRAGAVVCVTGHTLDDQAETVLLHLARGASAGGAAGMAVSGAWPVPGRGTRRLRLLRPLLDVTRVEVESYLDALGLEAVHDPSNATLEYARNRVRQQVLPALRQVNARAAEHLGRFAAQQREDDAALNAAARAWLEQHARMEAGGAGTVAFDRTALQLCEPAVSRRAVRLAAADLGVTLSAAHLQAILESAARGRSRVDVPLARTEASGTILWLRVQPPPSEAD